MKKSDVLGTPSVSFEEKKLLIQRIQNLPTLPTTLARIIEVVENPSSTAAELGEVISRDQSISSMILKLVNSAFYGHLRQVSSISHATVILGFQTVKTMALGVSIFQSAPPGSGHSFNRGQFWIHSIAVATCSKRLGSMLGLMDKDEEETVFLAGLLHDIGKVVFDNMFNEEYQKVVAAAKTDHQPIRDVEKKILDMDHTEAGSLLARRWQFPEAVINAIRFHHDPSGAAGGAEAIPSIVHAADYICRKMKLGFGGDYEETPLDAALAERMGLTGVIMDQVIASMESERGAIEAFTLD